MYLTLSVLICKVIVFQQNSIPSFIQYILYDTDQIL